MIKLSLILLIILSLMKLVQNQASWNLTTSDYSENPLLSAAGHYGFKTFENVAVFLSVYPRNTVFCNYYNGQSSQCQTMNISLNMGEFYQDPVYSPEQIFFFGTVENPTPNFVYILEITANETSISVNLLNLLKSLILAGSKALTIDYQYRWLIVGSAKGINIYDISNMKNLRIRGSNGASDSIDSSRFKNTPLHPSGISVGRGLICACYGVFICLNYNEETGGFFYSNSTYAFKDDIQCRSVRIFDDYIFVMGGFGLRAFDRNFARYDLFPVNGSPGTTPSYGIIDIVRSEEIIIVAERLSKVGNIYICNITNFSTTNQLVTNGKSTLWLHGLFADSNGIYMPLLYDNNEEKQIQRLNISLLGNRYTTFFASSQWSNYGYTLNPLRSSPLYFGNASYTNNSHVIVPPLVSSKSQLSVDFAVVDSSPFLNVEKIESNQSWIMVSSFTSQDLDNARIRIRFLEILCKDESQPSIQIQATDKRKNSLTILLKFNYTTNQTASVCVKPRDTTSEASSQFILVLGVVVCVSSVAILTINVYLVRFRRKRQTLKESFSTQTSKIEESLTNITVLSQFTQSSLPLSVPGYLIIDGSADVHLGDALGEGGFSQVHKGTALTSELRARAGGEEMAIKLMKDGTKGEYDQQLFEQEICILADVMKHDGFVQMVAYSLHPRMICMKLYPLGDLDILIHRPQFVVPWTPIALTPMMCDILKALHYLHSQSIYHGDIKPANILLDRHSENGRLCCLLSDFTLAYVHSSSPKLRVNYIQNHFRQVNGLSIAYAAPELFCASTLSPNWDLTEYPIHARDAYSMGIVLIEVASRQSPWPKPLDRHRLIVDIVSMDCRPQPVLKEAWAQQWYLIAQSLWHKQPQSRPVMMDIEHQLNALLIRTDEITVAFPCD